MVSYTFIDKASAALFGGGDDATMLANPISSEMSHMRPALRQQPTGDAALTMPEILRNKFGKASGNWFLQKHRPFLESIISIGSNAHMMHSAEATHVDKFFIKMGWGAERYGESEFALPGSFSHHKRRRGMTKAVFWRLSPSEDSLELPDRS